MPCYILIHNDTPSIDFSKLKIKLKDLACASAQNFGPTWTRHSLVAHIIINYKIFLCTTTTVKERNAYNNLC